MQAQPLLGVQLLRLVQVQVQLVHPLLGVLLLLLAVLLGLLPLVQVQVRL